MADLVRALVGADGTMVGDRPDTDGRFAVTLGYRYALVLSGVTTAADLPVEPGPRRRRRRPAVAGPGARAPSRLSASCPSRRGGGCPTGRGAELRVEPRCGSGGA